MRRITPLNDRALLVNQSFDSEDLSSQRSVLFLPHHHHLLHKVHRDTVSCWNIWSATNSYICRREDGRGPVTIRRASITIDGSPKRQSNVGVNVRDGKGWIASYYTWENWWKNRKSRPLLLKILCDFSCSRANSFKTTRRKLNLALYITFNRLNCWGNQIKNLQVS